MTKYPKSQHECGCVLLADDTVAHLDQDEVISESEMNRRLGITDTDLTGWEKIELE